MKSLYFFVAFLLIALGAYSQDLYKGDTTITLKANSSLKINVPETETWWLAAKNDPCVKFDNKDQAITLNSTCSEARKIKFIRTVQGKK